MCVESHQNLSDAKNNIHKTKTDKIDTYVIAKTLMMQDNLRFTSFYDIDMMDLKALAFSSENHKATHPFENPTDNLC